MVRKQYDPVQLQSICLLFERNRLLAAVKKKGALNLDHFFQHAKVSSRVLYWQVKYVHPSMTYLPNTSTETTEIMLDFLLVVQLTKHRR